VNSPAQRFFVVYTTLLAGLLLAIFPLPDWAERLRPDWVALILIYWCISLPNQTSLSTAFIFGLLLDIATGTLLGQHGLGLTLVCYIVLKNHARFRLFPLLQQGLLIMLILMGQQLIFLWIYGITNRPPENLWLYFLPSVIALVLWPWLYVFMRSIQRRFLPSHHH
jgi:rod shape-determining protein MreD